MLVLFAEGNVPFTNTAMGRRMSEANLDHSGTRALPAFLTAAARRLLNWLAWLVLLATAVMVWQAAAR
jgi:hypothetical protein